MLLINNLKSGCRFRFFRSIRLKQNIVERIWLNGFVLIKSFAVEKRCTRKTTQRKGCALRIEDGTGHAPQRRANNTAWSAASHIEMDELERVKRDSFAWTIEYNHRRIEAVLFDRESASSLASRNHIGCTWDAALRLSAKLLSHIQPVPPPLVFSFEDSEY